MLASDMRGMCPLFHIENTGRGQRGWLESFFVVVVVVVSFLCFAQFLCILRRPVSDAVLLINLIEKRKRRGGGCCLNVIDQLCAQQTKYVDIRHHFFLLGDLDLSLSLCCSPLCVPETFLCQTSSIPEKGPKILFERVSTFFCLFLCPSSSSAASYTHHGSSMSIL